MRAPSEKEEMVLRLIVSRADQYGLELLRDLTGEFTEVSTVYRALQRLEKKGFVVSELETKIANRPGRPRRLYRATELGLRKHNDH